MNAKDTVLSVFAKHVAVSIDSVMASPASCLLASGIVNPFGPTLECFVAVGPFHVGAMLHIVRLILNPFEVESAQVATLRLGTSWDPVQVISQLFPLCAGRACPSLILLHDQVEAQNAPPLVTEFLARFPDGRRVYQAVRKFYGNPWDRVSFEMESAAAGAVAAFKGGARPPQQLQGNEARNLAEMLGSPAHIGPEIRALLTAWQGAIDHAALPGMVSLPLKGFLTIMLHISEEFQSWCLP